MKKNVEKKRTTTSVKRKQAAKKQQTAPKPTIPEGARQDSKKDRVIALLQRDEGATLQELQDATGWQAHSVRGFISGTLKKKLGLPVKRSTADNGACTYQITAAPVER